MEVCKEELGLMIMKGGIRRQGVERIAICKKSAVNHMVSNISLHFAHIIFHTV